MSTIDKNSPIVPVLSDLMAVWQSSNSDTRRTSFTQVLALMQANLEPLGEVEPDSQYYAPNATGFTLAITDDDSDTHLIMTPTGTLAEGTITLPAKANLRDKQVLIVNTTEEITTFNIALNGSTAVIGAPTTLAANAYFTIKYDIILSTWYRIG